MATLLQLRRMVRNRLGVSSSDTFFRDDSLDDAINSAIATLESERNWPWQLRQGTLTTTIVRGIVELPDDWRSTRSLYYGTEEMSVISPADLIGWSTSDGQPQVYAHIGNELHIRPVPSSGTELTLLYYRTPTLLESDADVPDLPKEAYPAIVAKAAQLSSTREDDRPSAQSHLLEYTQWVERLQNVGESSKRPVGRRIRAGNWI